MTSRLISQSEYARQKGVSRQRINNLVSSGIINLVNGKVDPLQADGAIMGQSDPARDDYRKMKGRPVDAGTGAGSPYRQAATAEKYWKAKLAELEVKVREGELVNAAEYDRLHAEMVVAAKTRLRAIPVQVAQELFHMATTAQSEREGRAEIFKKLLAEIDNALLELSQWKPSSKKKREVDNEEDKALDGQRNYKESDQEFRSRKK